MLFTSSWLMLQVINGNLKKVNAHSLFDFFLFSDLPPLTCIFLTVLAVLSLVFSVSALSPLHTWPQTAKFS